jgi:hypothetical protein
MMKQALPHNRAAMFEPRQRFPMPVYSAEELSPLLRAKMPPYQPGETHIIRIPPGYYPFQRAMWRFKLPFGWRRTPERIMVFEPDAITIIESDPDGLVTATSVPRVSLLKIHVVVVLLYSYIELVRVDGDHVETKRIEYNTVGEPLILRGMDRIRAAYPPCLPPATVPAREEILAPLPFKFRHYLRASLLPNEQLRAAVYQSTIRQGVGPFRPEISPNRAVGITERHMVLIEDRRDSFSSDVDYAVFQYFYPLSHIQHMAVEVMPDVSWLRLQHGSAGVTQATDLALVPANADALWAVLQDLKLPVS